MRDPASWDLNLDLKRKSIENARRLRRASTLSERMLWDALRSGALGVKFRRQHPVGPFVIDFYCHSEPLVIEIDGRVHEALQSHDAKRQAIIESTGLKFLRIEAADVERSLPIVIERIRAALNTS